MSVLMRPREDGPIYVARAKRDGTGYVMVPYYAERDGERELSRDQLTDFMLATNRCGGLVVGRERP